MFDRDGGLAGLAVDFGDAVIEACYAKIKTKFWLAIISLCLMVTFGMIGIIFLFVLAFAALSQAYNPTVAAFSLFGVCLFICLGTYVVYKISIASLARKKPYRGVAKDRDQGGENLPPELLLGAEAGRLAKNFFGKNIPTSLVTSLIIGAVVGYMPKTSLKIMTRLAGMRKFRD